MEWIEQANKDSESNTEVMSFIEFMNHFENNPLQYCRPTSKYILDMLNYFGHDEKNEKFNLFTKEDLDCPAVYGQDRPEKGIVGNLKNFIEEGFNNKFILLVGPNGSAKSSIVKKIMKGAEIYSETEQGALHTFSWIFPIDTFVKGSVGLTSEMIKSDLETYAHLQDKEINAILNSELKDHPLLLIPKKYRENLLREAFADSPDYLNFLERSYFFKGALSKRNQMIYEALLKNYKGNHSEVLKHIRVERFNISRRYSAGAVTIEPQIHVDAQMQQITMDKRLASLPPSLQSLNLFSLRGEVIMANRGVLEYSDLLKRPLDTFKYLLMTMESSNINLGGILTDLDVFFIGTSNEIHLAGFKQHPDFNSFKGRFNFIRVPYLLNYIDEEKIYTKQINGLKDVSHFEPHALASLCLFSVMTRLRACQSKNYEDKKLSAIISNLNPLEKSLLLAEDILPERLDTESKQALRNGKNQIIAEFENENLYEGKFGISPRDIKNIIYQVSYENHNITFIEIFDFLEKLILKKNDFDFLNMTPQGDYHNPIRFINLIKNHFINIFDSELRECLGLVDERSYETYIKKYITNINALIKGEKVKNAITEKYEEPDQYFIKEFETSINLKEDSTKFRSHLISKLGAFALDNPGQQLTYTNVFPELVKSLQESFRNEQKKLIQSISKNLVFFQAETERDESIVTPMSDKDREAIQSILTNLTNKYQYSKQGALAILQHLIKERY